MASNGKISLIQLSKNMIFYMLEMPNHIFSKIDSIGNADNWLKNASNNTYSNPIALIPVLGWFMRLAYFLNFLDKICMFFSRKRFEESYLLPYLCKYRAKNGQNGQIGGFQAQEKNL